MVFVAKKPGSFEKLKALGQVARFDVCGFPSIFIGKGKKRYLRGESSPLNGLRPASPKPKLINSYIARKFQRFKFIYPAVGKGGRCVRLFKVLQSNACDGNCFYCANRRDRDFQRISFSPQELARLFIQYYERGAVDGLFLSSAISESADKSEERMSKTLQILRYKYGYRGYIHYKILPGTTESLIEEASHLADRLSINLEAPDARHLARLSPTKDFSSELLAGLRKIARLNGEKPLKAGITTQLVIGAAKETDREILNFSSRLYREYKLWRVYYSAFMPIVDTPLEEIPPCPPLREFRLYQADFLLRRYGFTPEELPFDEDGSLPQKYDPKLGWALRNPDKFPIEVNKADFEELLRVPGIGRISAQRIVENRKMNKLGKLEDLRITGAVISRARNFVTLDGKFFPTLKKGEKEEANQQLFLWEEI